MTIKTDRCDLHELARLLGVTEKAVRDWIDQGLPVVKRGARGGGKVRRKTIFSLRAAVAWYARHVAERAEHQRLLREKVDAIAMANAERRRELIPRFDVEQEQARTFNVIARFHETLPDLLERDCGLPPDAVSRVEGALDRVREEMYQALVGPEGHNGSSRPTSPNGAKSADIGPL